MTALPSSLTAPKDGQRSKLGKTITMLGSDVDGDVSAAARAIVRMLRLRAATSTIWFAMSRPSASRLLRGPLFGSTAARRPRPNASDVRGGCGLRVETSKVRRREASPFHREDVRLRDGATRPDREAGDLAHLRGCQSALPTRAAASRQTADEARETEGRHCRDAAGG